MERFAKIPAEVERYAEAWYSFPQSFMVPRGCYYRKDTDREFLYVCHELTIDL